MPITIPEMLARDEERWSKPLPPKEERDKDPDFWAKYAGIPECDWPLLRAKREVDK